MHRVVPLGRMQRRTFSSSVSGERLRIAVVGGGVAGMTAALHLSQLVERGLVAQPIDLYAAPSEKRDIGVGLWSTALQPLAETQRPSHQLVLDDFEYHGTWLEEVGYRTPSGSWLAKSLLPSKIDGEMPGLLFLREKDMLNTLQKGVHLEVQKGTLSLIEEKVQDISQQNPFAWSSQLVLGEEELSERDYHLIIAADGVSSFFRQKYGGYAQRKRLPGTNIIDTKKDQAETTSWEVDRQAQATAIEDRNYSVLRGNAPMTNEEAGGISFQTWGESQSMRFAAVPLAYPSPKGRVENQVWFATTSSPEVVTESDPEKRKEKLLETFSSWHDPIVAMMECTPADEIVMERAVAHRHSMEPVFNVHSVLSNIYGKSPSSAGPGPAMVFLGDAYMTVDPILAQGFTLAMEGAHALVSSLESSCEPTEDKGLAFSPYRLRQELQGRHDRRNDRIVALLRATEIVQALGQPSNFTGVISRFIVRPCMNMTPGFIKTPIFNAMLKYSLGK